MSQATMDANTHAFKAETRQLLDIVIHSLYSNKEIFLRELISNASDALDRLRFEALTTPDLCDSGEILEIRLEVDPAARTLSISDNGIGMSRDEVVENLGTIAKSGTRDVLRRLEASGQSGESLAQLIGQFGVGFYSAFMVADKVSVVTRRAGEQKATRWESTGGESFEVGDDHRFFRGTTVTLHLKPVDADDGVEDYTDVAVLERIVKRHSDFIPYPIRAKRPRVDATGHEEPGAAAAQPASAAGGGALEEVTLNSMRPVWTRPDSEVKEEEYTELYHHISHDWGEPLDRISLRAEGRVEYQALLFIPGKAPFDLFLREQRVGLQLYVRRVLILDRCEALLPGWLRFLRGVVDASDLELNVSRELLQHDRRILQMRRWLTRKVLDHLHEMKRNDEAKYQRFWAELGRVLKEGVASDGESRDRLVPLLLFPSSRDGALTDLAGYVSRMKEGQSEIYYLAGDNRSVIESSPHLEAFTEQGYEVLYLLDPVDELMVPSLGEFEGKRLRSAAEGAGELGSEEERKTAREELERKSGEYRDLLASLEGRLDAWVRQVRLSTRLKASPARLVTEEGEMSPHLERLLRQTDAGLELPARKRVLELNPAHEVVTKLHARYAEDRRDPRLDDYAYLLLGYALLAEGSELPDPARFNRLLVDLMGRGL